MGAIEDIMSAMRKGPEFMSQVDSLKLNTKSVARGANDSTFQFSCLVPDTMPIDMANTLAATLDRVYASFTQTWLSLHPMMDISMDRSPVQFLKKFHTNVKLEETIEDLSIPSEETENYLERAYNGEYTLFMNRSKTYGVLFNKADKGLTEMVESHKDYLRDFLSDFDTTPYAYTKEADDNFTNSGDLAQALINGKMQQVQDQKNKEILQASDKIKAPQLTDRDVKRTNDMIPFGIQCHLMAVNDKGEFVQYMDFIVGVKTILHIVKSDEMILNITKVLQNRSAMFKFLKWTSGEISFFKNLVLDLDNLKFDATSNANNRNPWFATLKRLKRARLRVHSGTVPYSVVPSSTLVVTSYEADYLEQKLGVNLHDPKIGKKLIQDMFLMTFIIVDDGTRTIDILYDGSDDYQTYALETLERQVSMNSNSLGREIGRMISH